jgi:rRNA maturation endonuclease Nob1
MSMVENLKTIKAKGMTEFLAEQAEKYRCPNCREVFSVQEGKCYSCGYTTKNSKPKSIEKARQLSAKKH